MLVWGMENFDALVEQTAQDFRGFPPGPTLGYEIIHSQNGRRVFSEGKFYLLEKFEQKVLARLDQIRPRSI